jgi:GNAT superfamily N-acetyltransferase
VSATVRPARAEDAAAIAAMANALNVMHGKSPTAFTAELVWRDMIGPDRAIDALIAESEGEPVGYCFYYDSYNTDLPGRGVWLEDLFVLPEARGRGIGRALIAAVARIVIERGARSLGWSVVSANATARRFYAGLGARDEDAQVLELDGPALARLAADG